MDEMDDILSDKKALTEYNLRFQALAGIQMFTKLRQQPASLIPRSEIPTQPYGRASCI